MWVLLYCFVTRTHLCIFFLLRLPRTGMVGPGTLYEVAVPTLSIHLLGRANTFSFLPLLSTPRKFLKCSTFFTLFLSASISLLSILVFTSVLYPSNISMDSISSWFPPMYFMLSHLRYPTLFQLALLLLFPIQPYQLWLATSYLACSLLYTAISTFSRLNMFQVGTFPVLLLILHYSSYLNILVLFSSCHKYCFQLFFERRVPVPYFSCMF